MALTDKLAHVRRGHAPRRASSACRPTSTRATRISRSRTARFAMRSARSRASARRRWKPWSRSASAERSLQSLEDFAARIDPRLLNRRQLESLAGAGAFDAIKPDRAAVFAAAETILAHAASAHEQRESGQAGLFGADSRRSRADPPATRRIMDAGAAHGGRARCLRLLFLGASGRCATASARGAQGARRSPSSPTCRIAEGRAHRGDAWRPGRGSALADLGEGPPLHDGDAQRPFGPVRGDASSTTRRPRRSKRRRRPGSAVCSQSSSTAAPATKRRASRSSASSRWRPRQANAAADDGSACRCRDSPTASRAS